MKLQQVVNIIVYGSVLLLYFCVFVLLMPTKNVSEALKKFFRMNLAVCSLIYMIMQKNFLLKLFTQVFVVPDNFFKIFETESSFF